MDRQERIYRIYSMVESNRKSKGLNMTKNEFDKVVEDDDTGTVRNFNTGATRDTAEGKFDYEGFLSPAVVERFAEYMHKNRIQADGDLRDSDNWQKGIPKQVYMKSAWRHFVDMWKSHRGIKTEMPMDDILCALLFNVMGYLFEELYDQKYYEIKESPVIVEKATVQEDGHGSICKRVCNHGDTE